LNLLWLIASSISIAACCVRTGMGAMSLAASHRPPRAVWALFLSFLLSLFIGAAQAHSADLLVVSPDRSAGYSEASQEIAAEWRRLHPEKSDVHIAYLSEAGALDGPHGGKVIVTLGSEALTKVLAQDLRVPIVAALIPKAGFERVLRESPKKPAAPVQALFLEQPIGRQVELLRLVLPEAKRVGVLWGAESSREAVAVGAALHARGLDLVGAIAGDSGQIFAGLKTVLDDTDVLLALPDPLVYNGATVANVLLATYRARVPVMAFSPAYVRAGAMFSLHSTPRQIGQQAAAMARALGSGTGSQLSQYPSEFTVSVNQQVARSLGFVLDEQSLAERLRRVEKRP
jgi:putative ABC transport system substrate-binding protein